MAQDTTTENQKTSSSVASQRLKVAKTVDTTLTTQEDELWADMTEKRLKEEKARDTRIKIWIGIAVTMLVSLVFLLNWWFKKYYGITILF